MCGIFARGGHNRLPNALISLKLRPKGRVRPGCRRQERAASDYPYAEGAAHRDFARRRCRS
jgi:hypothetical protein